MNHKQAPLTDRYINACRHPAIQNLKPQLTDVDLVLTETDDVKLVADIPNAVAIQEKLIWLPTLEQLLSALRGQVTAPIVWRECSTEGWECIVTISEWAADYETYIDTQRRFVGTEPKQVAIEALGATLGIGERWMV